MLHPIYPHAVKIRRLYIVTLAAGSPELGPKDRVFGRPEYSQAVGDLFVFTRLLTCSPTSFANATGDVGTFFERP